LGDIDEGTLDDVAKDCAARGATVRAVVFDQRVRSTVDDLFSAAVEQFGRIDTVANIAGIYPFATAIETTDEMWADVLATNLTGVFSCCRAALRVMVPQQRGCIVNISSGAAEIPYAGLAAYSASKGGIEALTRVLAKESAPWVRVNAIAPGPTLTHPHEESEDDGTAGEDSLIAAATITASIPLGRWIEPEEIARTIAFLASDQASAIHGQIVRVNGGNHMA
jgi:3-oxoacyl-[acyl-carrier protein] reductase